MPPVPKAQSATEPQTAQANAMTERTSRGRISFGKVLAVLVVIAFLGGFALYAIPHWGLPWHSEDPEGSDDVTDAANAMVKLTAAEVEAAEQNDAPVVLEMDAVEVSTDAATAPAFTVQSEVNRMVKVEVPVVSPTAGTVAMLVDTNGAANVIKTSVVTENGIVFPLTDSSTVKIVDNGKEFADVPTTAWCYEAVTFATARELFSGTSETNFSPDAPMTRAMLMVVLARLDGADVAGGSTWYEKATNWAIERGVSDGNNPNADITREQLITMLWRYMGSPVDTSDLSGFTDFDQVSDYARDAVCWAVNNGLVIGFDDGRLAPQSHATRAQVAKILKNLILNTM